MAPLRPPHPDATRGVTDPSPASINWPLPHDDIGDIGDLEQTVGQPRRIELHGSAYVAFCKAWAPPFVPLEEGLDDG